MKFSLNNKTKNNTHLRNKNKKVFKNVNSSAQPTFKKSQHLKPLYKTPRNPNNYF